MSTDTDIPERCVILIDRSLPPGLAANAAAVLALTLGAAIPQLPGPDLADADDNLHPGLIPTGLPIVSAPGTQLPELRSRALAAGVRVIDFPTFGQQTTDYHEFRAHVAATPTDVWTTSASYSTAPSAPSPSSPATSHSWVDPGMSGLTSAGPPSNPARTPVPAEDRQPDLSITLDVHNAGRYA